jgi:aminoglycoside phosphotransferase (APT) family kinase protein
MKPITEASLTAYLAPRTAQWPELEIANLHRLPMGASRETYRFDLTYRGAAGRRVSERVILRRDPPASNVESTRRHEYESYRAIHGHGIPVPKMILLEEDPQHFDGAISLAEDLRGFHNSEYQLQQPTWRDRLPKLAEQMWSTMGKLAAIDIAGLGLESFMRPATRESAARQELDYWIAILDKNDVGAEPITRAAIRFLLRRPPVAQKLCMVHGDFRAGNFLYDDNGDIVAILDWEMAHIGDPLEDLAWSLTRTFSFGKDDRRSGLATKDVAVAAWQRGSGLKADPEALLWYELFTCVKAQAIWASAAYVWNNGTNRDVILAYAPWWLRNAQDRATLELMGKL